MKKILISGKAGAGKDQSAQFVQEELERRGYTCRIFHFADTLKFICKHFYGWNGEKDDYGRNMLQQVGTEYFRNEVCETFWVDLLSNIIECPRMEADFVIIPDARFRGEIEGFSRPITVRIERPNNPGALTGDAAQHQSEVDLDDYKFHYLILNDGDLDTLKQKISYLVDRLTDTTERNAEYVY